MKIDLQKSLDYAIRDAEIKESTAKNEKYIPSYGYIIPNIETPYDNYLSNDAFNRFKSEMHPNAYIQFGKGGGSELEERKNKNKVVVGPPKMASFGSSSRMMYNTSKNILGFNYEKKLSTTVGGTANLDGFLDGNKEYIFVEAKCREPYGVKGNEIKSAYYDLYNEINKHSIGLKCSIMNLDYTPATKTPTSEYMIVDFMIENKTINHFDIKQMICHMLGIATAILKKNDYTDKPITFLYLIYNPTQLPFDNTNIDNEIRTIYKDTCDECESINFTSLFEVILKFLQNYKYNKSNDININKILNGFRFELCDQNNFCEKVGIDEMIYYSFSDTILSYGLTDIEEAMLTDVANALGIKHLACKDFTDVLAVPAFMVAIDFSVLTADELEQFNECFHYSDAIVVSRRNFPEKAKFEYSPEFDELVKDFDELKGYIKNKIPT